MRIRLRPVRELRAFDWVDYVLYLLATSGFVIPMSILIFTGEYPSFLGVEKDFGLAPNLLAEANQQWYQVTAGLFGLFVVLVYVRNYIVMHRIDDRRDGTHYIFYFVDYNLGVWSRLERIFRAMIVLWVLTTTIGAVRFVTSGIYILILEFYSSVIGLAAFQDITMIQGFFAYYGLVILVLFVLFMCWDIMNIASIGRHIRSRKFDCKTLGPPGAFDAVPRARKFIAAIPPTLSNAIPVYTIITYIQPRERNSGEMDTHREAGPFDGWAGVRERIAEGRLLRLYFNFSNKFVERMIGLTIGTLLFLSPALAGSGLIYQTIFVLIALGVYLVILWPEIIPTIRDAFYLLIDYVRYKASSWETPVCEGEAPQPNEGSAP